VSGGAGCMGLACWEQVWDYTKKGDKGLTRPCQGWVSSGIIKGFGLGGLKRTSL
jgi:hypothetical protein